MKSSSKKLTRILGQKSHRILMEGAVSNAANDGYVPIKQLSFLLLFFS